MTYLHGNVPLVKESNLLQGAVSQPNFCSGGRSFLCYIEQQTNSSCLGCVHWGGEGNFIFADLFSTNIFNKIILKKNLVSALSQKICGNVRDHGKLSPNKVFIKVTFTTNLKMKT